MVLCVFLQVQLVGMELVNEDPLDQGENLAHLEMVEMVEVGLI